MRLLDLQQGTPAWHAWRKGGVGASDLATICGLALDPRRPVTLDDLLAEKLGTGQRQESFAMRRGRSLESPALRLLEEREGLVLRPACVEHDEQGWIRASLDGLTFLQDTFAEIKCLKVVDHELALAGIVPHQYRPQLQWQLLVTELEEGLYASYSTAARFGGPGKPSLAVVVVKADAEAQAELIEQAGRFWQKVEALRKAQGPREVA